MESENLLLQLPQALLPWYDQGHRDLPWRNTQDPYPIWLSEIMLQQTRVEAVKGYYHRFLEALPTIQALAECPDEALHKLWEGLGYYSRVRNLKKAAQVIQAEYGGVFPREYPQVLALPGIGSYTAGAICSIAFNLPTPAVDGNVLRVIARLTNDFTPVDLPAYKEQVRQALADVYPAQAGGFTQALMELGATLCGPNRKPQCLLCPCRSFCQGAAQGTAEQLPQRLPKRKRRLEKRTVFILSCGDDLALEKRPEQGLLAGLWQFPNVEGWLEIDQALQLLVQLGVKPVQLLRQVHRTHIFTHIQWDMQGIYIETAERTGPYSWLSAQQIQTQAALPTAFRQFWEEIGHV